MRRSVVLVVLDGWGMGRKDITNPINSVKPDTFEYLEKNFPTSSLQASGISVGLPWGEIGNSEVGHLTIGAGKVLYQYYPKISLAIRNGEFFENETLKAAFSHSRNNNLAINFVGILSKANVHASLEHLQGLIKMAEKENVPFKLHLFADGKDSTPKLLETYLSFIPKESISTLTGRYYAMNREENWDLTRQTYDTLTSSKGKILRIEELPDYLKEFFKKNKSEEFLPPLRFGGEEKNIQNGESIVFFNFREDSIRQLTSSFLLPNFQKFPVKDLSHSYIATMTPYSDAFDVPVVFPPDKADNCLAKVISEAGLSQLRIAESYKYAHITYFFNAFREEPFPNEYRVVIPSEPIPHPDEHPEMMNEPITERLLSAVNEGTFDFILANYASPDSIAHTGNFSAAEDTVRSINENLKKVINTCLNNNSYLIITSDHGNIEELINPISGRVETGHNPSPVPIYLVHPSFENRKFVTQGEVSETIGLLSDIAPTILEILGIPQPEEMNGKSLLQRLV